MIKHLGDLFTVIKNREKKIIAVACAGDEEVLKSVKNACERGIANFILVGKEDKIRAIAEKVNLDLTNIKIIHDEDMTSASLKAISLVSSGKAHIVMKGLVDTSIVLKAVLNKEIGLRTGKVLSHIALMEVESYHKVFVLTDAAMIINPTFEEKKQMIGNALAVTKALGIEKAKVVPICAKEKVNPKMPETVDAAELARLSQAGELGDCIVEGPYALDIAFSQKAAETKGVNGLIPGDVDILLMPNLVSGNILYKTLVYLSHAKVAGVIMGARAPIVLTSRADSDEGKLYSMALAVSLV